MRKIPNPNKMKRVQGPVLSNLELKSAKVRVTTYIDEDILKTLREVAAESGNKYQTFLNHILRSYLLGPKEGLMARLSRLERAVFKPKAA